MLKLAEPFLSMLSPLWAVTNTLARPIAHLKSHTLPVPVISVGNILAGGVGKTEIVSLIAEKLLGEKKRVTVLMRGYGSKWEKRSAIAQDFNTAASQEFPDESLVLLKKNQNLSVAIGRDRYAVATKHWEELQPHVVLLDDGFQHFSLKRDLDILVHNFNVRWPIIRDLPNQFLKVPLRVAFSEVPRFWLRRDLPWVRAEYELTNSVNASDKLEALPKEALVFCGLGNPHRFKESLKKANVRVAGLKTFRDHKAYKKEDVQSIMQWRKSKGSLPLLTTLKDFVKLQPFIESQGGISGFEPSWVNLKIKFHENEQLFWHKISETLAVR